MQKQTMNIPHADNPQHTENLASIPLLEAQGFIGSDADLATSLFEYGMAWREIGDEVLIIHGIRMVDSDQYTHFDRCTLKKDLDVRKEYDWADFDAVLSFVGMSADEWDKMTLTQKIADLLSYYGAMEIFGESYWEGFTISEA